MAKRYQILARPAKPSNDEDKRWRFIAHGSPYNEDELDNIVPLLKRNGNKVKLILL